MSLNYLILPSLDFVSRWFSALTMEGNQKKFLREKKVDIASQALAGFSITTNLLLLDRNLSILPKNTYVKLSLCALSFLPSACEAIAAYQDKRSIPLFHLIEGCSWGISAALGLGSIATLSNRDFNLIQKSVIALGYTIPAIACSAFKFYSIVKVRDHDKAQVLEKNKSIEKKQQYDEEISKRLDKLKDCIWKLQELNFKLNKDSLAKLVEPYSEECVSEYVLNENLKNHENFSEIISNENSPFKILDYFLKGQKITEPSIQDETGQVLFDTETTIALEKISRQENDQGTVDFISKDFAEILSMKRKSFDKKTKEYQFENRKLKLLRDFFNLFEIDDFKNSDGIQGLRDIKQHLIKHNKDNKNSDLTEKIRFIILQKDEIFDIIFPDDTNS